MGAEPFAPSWPPPLMGKLLLLGPPRRKQMQLTLENLMRQCARMMSTQEVKMPGLWARRLVEDEMS